VRVRHPAWVRGDAEVPRRGVVRAVRGVRSRHGDGRATRVAERWWWIEPRSARVGVVDGVGDE